MNCTKDDLHEGRCGGRHKRETMGLAKKFKLFSQPLSIYLLQGLEGNGEAATAGHVHLKDILR